jgi:hypothetical protein
MQPTPHDTKAVRKIYTPTRTSLSMWLTVTMSIESWIGYCSTQNVSCWRCLSPALGALNKRSMKSVATGTGGAQITFFSSFRKSVEKIQISLQSDKNNWYSTWKPLYIFDHMSLNSSQNNKYFWQVADNIKTHILCSTPLLRKSHPLWDNVVK